MIFNFQNKGGGNRNRIFVTRGQEGFITLPIKNPAGLQGTFGDFISNPNHRWLNKIKKNSSQTYCKMLYFTEMFNLIEPHLEKFAAGKKSLADIESFFPQGNSIMPWYNINFFRSSEFNTNNLQRSERVLALIKAVRGTVYYAASGSVSYMKDDGNFNPNGHIYVQDFEPRPYP